MRKRISVIVEDTLLDEAARVLGTNNASETIRESLAQTVRQAHLNRLAVWELPADFPARLAEMRAA